MDAFGRKRSTTSVFIPFIAGWAVIVNARSLSAIYIGTALHGVASGMTMTSSVYVSEISPAEYRGFSLSLLGLSYMLGTVACSALQCLISWIYTAACFLVASVVMFAAIYLVPESPYWLIMRGRIDDATKILLSIRKAGDSADSIGGKSGEDCKKVSKAFAVEREILDIKRCIQASSDQYRRRSIPKVAVIKTCDDDSLSVEDVKFSSNVVSLRLAARSIWGGIRDTVVSLTSVWKQMLILTVFAILHKLTGYTPLAQYTIDFFKELNPPIDSDLASLIHFIVCLASTVAAPYFVHHYDRRVLLCATSAAAGCGMAVTLLYEVVYLSYGPREKPHYWTPLIGVYTYDAASTLGLTSILVMLPAELLPTEISGTASVAFSIICSIATTLISKTYLTVFACIGLVGLLSVFVSSCFLVALLAIIFLPETRGKTLHEIQRIYFFKKQSTSSMNVTTTTNSLSSIISSTPIPEETWSHSTTITV